MLLAFLRRQTRYANRGPAQRAGGPKALSEPRYDPKW